MPKNFVQQAFHTWLEQNRSRFTHPPTQVRFIRGCVEFYFSGVSHAIAACIYKLKGSNNYCGCSIAYTFQNEMWDLIFDNDVSIERDADGYYCGLCIAGDGNSIKEMEKRFSSRLDLLVDHVFEPMLEWCNGKLHADVCALVCGSRDEGMTWVTLASKQAMSEGKVEAEHSVAIVPVLIDSPPIALPINI